jgi:site-specific DNA recombinase
MKTAVLYSRFSSDLQKDRSIDDQLALCRTLAEREQLNIVATFSDRAKSGATMFERDGLLELMQAAKARKFDVVIVDSLDRMSRDTEDLAGLFKRLKFYGIDIRSVFDTNGGVVTSMHVSVKGMTGSMFLEQLAHNVKRGQNGLVSEGKIPGTLTYGYRCVPGKPGDREIDPAEATVIKRIFNEYAEGQSPRTIANNLNRDGIPAPRGAKRWNYNSLICGTSLKRGMIGNPIYRGELIWNVNRTARDPNSGKKVKQAAPARARCPIWQS